MYCPCPGTEKLICFVDLSSVSLLGKLVYAAAYVRNCEVAADFCRKFQLLTMVSISIQFPLSSSYMRRAARLRPHSFLGALNLFQNISQNVLRDKFI